MKRIVFLSFLLMILLSSFCLAVKLEEKKDIINLRLSEYTVIFPGKQNLTIEVEKPIFSTPKGFSLRIVIFGPGTFEKGEKEKTLSLEEISEKIIAHEIIKIDNTASGQGEEIGINYTFRYKSSSFGKIDENFNEFSGSLSFKGAYSDSSSCEEKLGECIEEKDSLVEQLSKTDSKFTNELSKNLSDCQENLESKRISSIKLTISLVILFVLFGLFLFLWLKEQIKRKHRY